MKITVAQKSGFCFGVARAVALAEEAGAGAVTFGEIIHNEYAVASLAARGIVAINEVSDAAGKTVVVRSHGVSPKVFEELRQSATRVVDATCPFVKKIQNTVCEYSKKGYRIVIIGKASHPEVIGVSGYALLPPIIIESEEDVLPDLSAFDKVAIVVQTTFSPTEYGKIIDKISKSQSKTVEIFDTICYTTKERQQEAAKLSSQCDCIIVIGSEKSSNTQELFDLCKRQCPNTFFCQNASEARKLDLNAFENIGIVAGASTPKELIKEVTSTMEEMNKVNADNEISMEDVMNDLGEKKNFKRGQIIECTIESVADDGLHLSIPQAKTEILLPKEEINIDGSYDKTAFNVGDKISVKVVSNENKLIISKKAIELDIKADAEIAELLGGNEFTMAFSHSNKGGLQGRMGNYKVFVPSSQIRIGFVNEKDFEKYYNKKLRLRVIKQEGKDIVASARVILEEERKNKDDAFWDKIKEGEIVKGKVMRFTNFGAFVSVDGFDCLAHISDLSWDNVKSCDEILTIGEEYDFKVLKADRETKKVSLGYKQLTKRPIEVIAEKYPVGAIVHGTVTKLMSFGALVEIEPKVEGLVHISQVSHTYVDNIAHALSVGDEVDVKVIEIDTKKNKINLSIKALLPEPEKKPEDEKQPRKERKPRREQGEREQRDDELTSWVTGDGGASIADLLSKLDDKN